jgi:hypothetical protein
MKFFLTTKPFLCVATHRLRLVHRLPQSEREDVKDKIKRAFYVELQAGADTQEDLMSLVNHMFDEMDRGSNECVTGSPSSGGHFKLETNPEMTHEKYFEELEKQTEI